ncbi:D-ribitol-5-phosphate cytidylyltransferase-like isoform X1 [Thrips palmi]|uniref:D-ribitol-5-phosphate cytidylyltransferase-like isoform X1 n=1 Tax=Thrips palmi TaxID=161013 RepID=A0A6P8YLS2_THRPL|nr:D-ribitol-5-phosphate cytidylyltransferase-like isoform X1 [Thrips palmi]
MTNCIPVKTNTALCSLLAVTCLSKLSSKMIDFDVGVILPAAGSGERLGGSTPKQYCKILDKPLFLYALEAFEKISYIRRIALVVDDPGHVEALLQESNCHKVLVVQGESTRHRSIRAGLQALTKQECDLRIVIVHDAVRPIVPEDLIELLVKAADETGAAGSVCPLVSTVLSAESDGSLKTALDRKSHLASETPQAFQTNVLVSSYNKCSEEDLDCGTECLQLALTYGGIHARLVEGSPNDLWKVTISRDLYTASQCLRERNNSVCIMGTVDCEPARLLAQSLMSCVKTVERVVMSNEEDVQRSSGLRFNNVVFFHTNQIDMERSLLNFAALFDLDNQGLIIHILEQENAEELQNMNVYDLQSSGRKMARQYHKLKKGVVVIHCLDNEADSGNLVRLVTTLIQTHPYSMTGQTLFL